MHDRILTEEGEGFRSLPGRDKDNMQVQNRVDI